MALLIMQATSISRQVITIGHDYSRLGMLSNLPPLSLINMLPTIGGSLESSYFHYLHVAHLFGTLLHAYTLVFSLWSLFLFLSLSWVFFFFIKFGWVSMID